MAPADYTAVRCGMNVSKAIIKGEIDAGIGLENVQMVELQEWLAAQGRPKDDVQMLRIDELAELGCCCFCSILYIGGMAHLLMFFHFYLYFYLSLFIYLFNFIYLIFYSIFYFYFVIYIFIYKLHPYIFLIFFLSGFSLNMLK